MNKRINSLKYQIGVKKIALGPLLSKYDLGGVSREDLTGVLRGIDSSLTTADVAGIIQRINRKGQARLQVSEISRFFRKLPESYSADIEAIIQEITNEVKTKNLSLFEIFQTIDVDRSGDISLEEFEKLVKRLSPRMTKERIWWLFRRFDKNSNGSVSFEEFSGFFQQLERTDQRLLKLETSMREKALTLDILFKKYDDDNSGFIE